MFNSVHSIAFITHIRIYYGYVTKPHFTRKKSMDYAIVNYVENICVYQVGIKVS